MNVVIVTWIDAAMSGHWQDGDLPPPDEPEDNMVHSVGWIARFSDDFVTLVQSITSGQHGNAITIPMGMVKQITPLPLPMGDQ